MYKTVRYWFVAVIMLLSVAFLYLYLTSNISLISHFTIFIWIISGIGALYAAKNGINRGLNRNERYILILTGVGACIFSFICVDTGFCNRPYSIGEFSILLSGLSIILFTCMNLRPVILPAAFPLITILLYQVFDIFQENIDKLSQPFVKPTTEIVAFILEITGIGVKINENVISFHTVHGVLMPIRIVSDCTGIWSLSAFTASLVLVAFIFPNVFSRNAIPFIIAGYIGTYIANILRVVLICISAFYFDYSGTTRMVHIHAGWIAFSTWMILFWYVFFSKYLLKNQMKRI